MPPYFPNTEQDDVILPSDLILKKHLFNQYSI